MSGLISNGTAQKLIEDFNKKYGNAEKALVKLFENKEDYSIATIYARVALLDRVYSTRLRDYESEDSAKNKVVTIDKMARYIENNEEILKQYFDNGNLDAVKCLMKVSFSDNGNKQYNNVYSFATKYCSFMNPEKYPIYDSRIDKNLKILGVKNKKITMYNNIVSALDTDDGYNNLNTIMHDLIEKKAISGCSNLKDLDKILWMYEKD